MSEKGVYCLTRPIGLNCLNFPKKSLKTNNSHHSSPTGNYLVTHITSEHSDINKVLTNCTGIILVTHRVILSIAKNLAVSDFGDVCTDLEIFRYAQDDTY